MKQKVGQAAAYNQWNPAPLPHAHQIGMSNNQMPSAEKTTPAVNRMNLGPNIRPASRMKGTQQMSSANKPMSHAKSRISDQVSDDDYEEDDFDKNVKDDGTNEMENMRRAMRAQPPSNTNFSQEPPTKYKIQAANIKNPLQVQRGLDAFTQQRGLIVADSVNHMAVNRQKVRAKELRELIQLSSEEQFNMFEMVPQTPQDIYRNKLQSEVIKTQLVATNDEMIDQEVQTDDAGSVSVGTQKPEEQNPQKLLAAYDEYQKKSMGLGLGKKKNVDLGNIKLQKFLDQAAPVMLKVIEESQ